MEKNVNIQFTTMLGLVSKYTVSFALSRFCEDRLVVASLKADRECKTGGIIPVFIQNVPII